MKQQIVTVQAEHIRNRKLSAGTDDEQFRQSARRNIMKITQLFKIYWPDNGGGIAKVMESIADAFQDCEQEIIVCQNSAKKKGTDDSYRGVPVRRCRQMLEVCSTPISLQFLYDVKKRTKNSDIVIYHFPYPMVDLAIFLRAYSGRLIVWWHCGFEKYEKLMLIYYPFMIHTLEKADKVFVSSKSMIKNSKILRRFQKKCSVIPFCVSEECLERGKALANGFYRQKEQDDSDGVCRQKRRIRILFVGRLVWYKGCDILLKAFAKMKHAKCRLVLVGGGPLEQELKNLAANLKLENVQFTGMVSEEEKMRQLEVCDFLVLPSVSEAEAFAVVQLEAMAFGKPVINTALKSGVPKVSIDGVTGKTVKPGSVRELTAAMDELAQNAGLRKEYGMNALRIVQKHYTQEVMTRRLRKVLEVLEDKREKF